MRVFLGITGASGAPYAARLLEALVGAGCDVGVSASRAAGEVLATELDTDLATLAAPHGDAVRLYAPDDWSAPYASGPTIPMPSI